MEIEIDFSWARGLFEAPSTARRGCATKAKGNIKCIQPNVAVSKVHKKKKKALNFHAGSSK